MSVAGGFGKARSCYPENFVGYNFPNPLLLLPGVPHWLCPRLQIRLIIFVFLFGWQDRTYIWYSLIVLNLNLIKFINEYCSIERFRFQKNEWIMSQLLMNLLDRVASTFFNYGISNRNFSHFYQRECPYRANPDTFIATGATIVINCQFSNRHAYDIFRTNTNTGATQVTFCLIYINF